MAFFSLESPLLYSTASALFIFFLTLVSFYGWCRRISLLYLVWPLFTFAVTILAILTQNSFMQVCLFIFFGLGMILFIKNWKNFTRECFQLAERSRQFYRNISPWEKFLFIFTVIYLASYFCKSLIPGGHSDVIVYHLLGPKDWALFSSDVSFRPDYPNLFLCTTVEYFFYAFYLLFRDVLLVFRQLPGTEFEMALSILHTFSQILVSTASYIIVPYLIFDILKKYPYLRFLVIIAIFSTKLFSWTWFMAKSDSIPFYYMLAAYKLFRSSSRSDGNKLLASFILGMSVSAKFSNSLPLFFVLVAFFLTQGREIFHSLKEKKIQRLIIFSSMLFILGSSPIFLRNFYYTQNPFHPVDSFGFKNNYTGDFHKKYLEQYTRKSTNEEAVEKLTLFWKKAYPLMALVIISLLLKYYVFPIFFILVTIIITKITGSPIEWRLFSILLFLIIFWSEKLGQILFDSFGNLRNLSYLNNLKFKASQIITFFAIVTLSTSHFSFYNFWESGRKLFTKTEDILGPIEFFRPILAHNLTYYNFNKKNGSTYQPYTESADLYYSRFRSYSDNLASPEWRKPATEPFP